MSHIEMLRLPDVVQMTTMKRGNIYRLMAENRFPKQINLGGRSARWIRQEVEAWLQSRIDARAQVSK